MAGDEDQIIGSEAEVEAVIDEFGGDPKKAINALLHDLKVLADDHAVSVSRGYVRNRIWVIKVGKRSSKST